MSGFTSKLSCRVEPTHATVVILNRQLRYIDSNQMVYIVPKGFRCDLASVPRWLRSITTPWNQSARAGILHDCGYRWYELWKVPRKELDELYMQTLIDDRVSKWRAWIQKTAVRWRGGKAWNRWRETPTVLKGPKPLRIKKRGTAP